MVTSSATRNPGVLHWNKCLSYVDLSQQRLEASQIAQETHRWANKGMIKFGRVDLFSLEPWEFGNYVCHFPRHCALIQSWMQIFGGLDHRFEPRSAVHRQKNISALH
jgi:mannitol-1-phosphate/altronate dehydrogenase